jgi:hypothetical protein
MSAPIRQFFFSFRFTDLSSEVVFESGVAIVAESSGQLAEQTFFIVAEGMLVTQTV